MTEFFKNNPGRTGEWEAAGLNWLGEASHGGGAQVVAVQRRTADGLGLEKITEGRPNAAAAEKFGRQLFHTHEAGAVAFGAGPVDGNGNEWEGDGYQGPNSHLLRLPLNHWDRWGMFYANSIIEPLLREADGRFSADDEKQIAVVQDRLRAGEFDNISAPARVHGDLWAGNVLWSADSESAVLIDPAAHGGHPETDLAALALFGVPHEERIFAAYQEAAGWDSSWRKRIGLHQLHLLLLHVAVFGRVYRSTTMDAVQSVLRL